MAFRYKTVQCKNAVCSIPCEYCTLHNKVKYNAKDVIHVIYYKYEIIGTLQVCILKACDGAHARKDRVLPIA